MAGTTGRHRRPQPAGTGTTLAKAAGVTALGVSIPVLAAGTGQAAASATAAAATATATATWDKVAVCESGGDWTADTGNGAYGGLQISTATWDAYGGAHFAATPNRATEAEQIGIAQRVLQEQGPGAWPVCSVRTGLTRTNGAAAPARATTQPKQPAKKQPAPAKKAGAAGGTTREHTVRPGDTLSGVAQELAVPGGWEPLYQQNRGTIGGNPNLIRPGEHLYWRTGGTAAPRHTAPTPVTNRNHPSPVAQAAADWALQQVAAHTAGWYDRCDNFVARAYGRSSSGWTYAIDNWNGTPSSMKGPASDLTPPVGALVFWRMPDQPYGHVAIVVGDDGQIVTTNYPDDGDYVGETTVAHLTAQWGGTYLGWAWPDFL